MRAELNEQEPAESLFDAALERLERAVAYGRDVLDGEELAAFNKRLGGLAWTARSVTYGPRKREGTGRGCLLEGFGDPDA